MLTLAGIDVDGISIGGLETCIDLPGFKVAFDIGRAPDFAVVRETILFTHAHMDHMGGVAWHCATRSLRHMRPPTYLVPRENAEAFEELFGAWRKLDRSTLPHATIAIGPGEEHALAPKRIVRPFRSPHRAPCQGYSIWTKKRKLKPELAGLAEEEIQRMVARDRIEVSVETESPEVAFTGDALIEVVEQEEVVRKARLLIMEVTFLDERVSVADCRAKGHIHLDEVIERADLFENEALLFTHFSERYTSAEIGAILERRLPERLRARVTPLLAGRRA
jgi:ribonuclease Z